METRTSSLLLALRVGESSVGRRVCREIPQAPNIRFETQCTLFTQRRRSRDRVRHVSRVRARLRGRHAAEDSKEDIWMSC